MEMKNRKVGIIGVGHVGAHVAFSLVTQGIVDELVLVDIDKQKAISERHDLLDATAYLPHRIRVNVGEYEDLADCDIIVNSVGKISEDRDRLAELQNSVDMVKSYINRIMDAGFDGIIINITNPCDIIAYYIQQVSGLEPSRVIGTGTGLDSSRFKRALAEDTGVDEKSINGYTLGEHGDSQMIPWSTVSLGMKPLHELEKERPETFGTLDKEDILYRTVKGGWFTYEGKKATEFGIASTAARMIRGIYHDEKYVTTASTLLEGQFGEENLYISIPVVIGKDGVEDKYELSLTDEELAKFKNSCNVVKDYISRIK
ncbi:L-lactate dehydrogenase [Terrisporobacter sp.]|uniref:L-lactate dehydrogenase n=1 Tax=Terrisporobacter sp. TaxID=1965305 RepID=UPI0026377D0F|nr:L-lactate dehydrogenase [Terrisporobacter sp.]